MTFGTYVQSGAVLFKAGKNVSSSITGVQMGEVILQSEALVNSATRKDWSGAYATLSPNVKYILEMTTSAKAGMVIISFDMSGYSSRIEAETMLDVLKDEYKIGIKELNDIRTQDFMDAE